MSEVVGCRSHEIRGKWRRRGRSRLRHNESGRCIYVSVGKETEGIKGKKGTESGDWPGKSRELSSIRDEVEIAEAAKIGAMTVATSCQDRTSRSR